jgi:hypothetical protein
MRPVLDVRLGDRVSLKKVHPCGARTWDVVRLGADIGLVCTVCGRRVLLERAVLERRLDGFVHRGTAVEAEIPSAEAPVVAEVTDGPVA